MKANFEPIKKKGKKFKFEEEVPPEEKRKKEK